ncbi:MAG TPA: nucleoside transporter C-terminal domain-containing protein [Caulobacterales bacterium]|nr:nucleoside transporter C-terminal domain-containing protein [Caulobacterales bacterium]
MVYTLENARSLLGLALILLVCWLFSENKRRFPFLLTIGALAVQAGLVLALFAVPNSRAVLEGVNAAVDGLASATDHGTQFVFGFLGGGDQPYMAQPGAPLPFIFGFRVLPLILVISALSALLWHWQVLKWITRLFGLLFEKTMGLGGASALAVAANIFMGMVESPIVIRAYLDKLTRSELFLMMVVGLATVAGSTMVAYALILAPVLPNAAGHVLVASIISAPAGILLARIMIPEERGKGVGYDYASALKYESSMDAITRGVQDGVMVVVNVAAFLMVFVAFVWIINNLLALGPKLDGQPITLQSLFGYVFAPVAWAIGVPWREAHAAGGILGTKLFLTEFIAYIDLGAIPKEAMSDRTRMILTYAICGFANVASVGIMTGGMTVLMPERRSEILALAWKALLPGFLATLMTAAVVAALPAWLFA